MSQPPPIDLAAILASTSHLLDTHRALSLSFLAAHLTSLPAALARLADPALRPFPDPVALRTHLSEEEPAGKRPHAALVELAGEVPARAAAAGAFAREVGRFASLRVPACETGNNFGVEVQEMVRKAASESAARMEGVVEKARVFYKERGELQAKMGRWGTGEEETVVEEKNGTTETVKKQKMVVKSLEVNEDLKRCLIEFDIEWYIKFSGLLDSIALELCVLADLVTKNFTKLMDPRNHTDGSSHPTHMY